MCDKKFDREYSVTFIKEKKFLDACGIRYEFVKNVDGITTFKYKKQLVYLSVYQIFISNLSSVS